MPPFPYDSTLTDALLTDGLDPPPTPDDSIQISALLIRAEDTTIPDSNIQMAGPLTRLCLTTSFRFLFFWHMHKISLAYPVTLFRQLITCGDQSIL